MASHAFDSAGSRMFAPDSVGAARRLRRAPPARPPEPEPEPVVRPESDFLTRRFNWKAAFLIFVLHVLAIGAIVVQKHRMAAPPPATPVLVNLMAPAAPPAETPPPPEIAMTTPPVVVPPPVFTIANPPPSITAVVSVAPPAPVPARVTIAAAPVRAVAPVAAPAISEGADLSAGLIHARPPRYPFESRRLKEEGVVTLAVTLSPEGEVADISIRQSSGWSRLDNAALQAVRRWRWRPQMRDGQPVSVRGLVEIPFRLSR